MTLDRRGFLKLLAMGAVGTAGVSGCSRIVDEYTQPDLPDTLVLPTGQGRHPIAHLLNRANYGGRPGQIVEVEGLGQAQWLSKQLDYKSISDSGLELKLRRFDTLKMNSRDLASFKSGDDRRYVASELAAATLIRAVYSERQLYEVMVGFWTDHFSLYHFKESVASLKTADDRDVIRPYALGNFGDMLRASAHSPAMLVYLDNILNEKSHPNENYAREIMELHTLGVDGGYTEQDIQEVARCFTGWSVDRRGEFEFVSDWHDDGEKIVLGHTIAAGGGKGDGDKVLEILLQHPSIARFICTKLARRFYSDDPPTELVDSLSSTWQSTDGNIAAVVQDIFAYEGFPTAPPKLKRPFELVVSLLRATNAQYDGSSTLIDRLDRMGHRPFGWTTPDGYPDTALEWSGNMLARWNLCLDVLNGKLTGVRLDLDDLLSVGKAGSQGDEVLSFFGQLFFSRDLNETERTALLPSHQAPLRWDSDEKILRELIGLLVASPAFQWR